MMENDAINRITLLLEGIGFVILKEHEIVFNPPSSKISFIKGNIAYLKYKDVMVILDMEINKMYFRELGNIEKSFLMGEYFIPDIVKYLKLLFPKEVRKYKIKLIK